MSEVLWTQTISKLFGLSKYHIAELRKFHYKSKNLENFRTSQDLNNFQMLWDIECF